MVTFPQMNLMIISPILAKINSKFQNLDDDFLQKYSYFLFYNDLLWLNNIFIKTYL